MQIDVDSIVVGERRRIDPGDIAALADSIRRVSLIHPIVITDDHRLVAGGRRLEAVKALGWPTIEARLLTDLSEAELREIELEENLHRKDLTAYERSRTLVQLAETAAEVDRASFVRTPHETTGRPEAPGSLRRVSERTGVPVKTLHDAAAHVAAVEAHPQLATEPQSVALDYARAVKEQPELAGADVPPREIVNLARERKAAEAAKAAEDTKQALAAAGALEDVAQAAARSRVMRAVREATILLELDAAWAVSALKAGDEPDMRRFAGRMRAWLDAMEAALPSPVTILMGGKR